MTHSEQLHLVIQSFDTLPSLPGVAVKLIEALQQPVCIQKAGAQPVQQRPAP